MVDDELLFCRDKSVLDIVMRDDWLAALTFMATSISLFIDEFKHFDAVVQ